MQQSLRILWEGFYEIDEGHRCFGEFEQVLSDKVEGHKLVRNGRSLVVYCLILPGNGRRVKDNR